MLRARNQAFQIAPQGQKQDPRLKFPIGCELQDSGDCLWGFLFAERELPTETARNPNLAKVYRATYIPCPRCNQPIRKVACNSGSFFVTCENYLEISSTQASRDPGRRSPRCGQQMYIVALEGIAVVVPLRKDEFQKWLRTYPSALEVFVALGVVIDRGPEIEARIPVFNCKTCGDQTELHELYAGCCRRCSGMAVAS